MLETALPATERGPEERKALRRFAAICLMVGIKKGQAGSLSKFESSTGVGEGADGEIGMLLTGWEIGILKSCERKCGRSTSPLGVSGSKRVWSRRNSLPLVDKRLE
jgi:hypothetical protein